jgi:radical SAM protein with 4Fe4S-binding SPASM domain
MIQAPDYIQFYPTTRCNQECEFCFNQALPSYDDMSFDNFKRMVVVLKKQGIRILDVLGGEPTLHPDLMRIVRYSLQEGLKLNISSNGTGTTLLGDIRSRYPDIAVGVSICDRNTVPVLEGFVKKHRLIVKTVVGRALDPVLIDSLLASGASEVNLIYRDALKPEQLPETAPFDAFFATVRERYDPDRVGMVHCSGFLPDIQRYPFLLKARCPAGSTKLGVLPDGSVYPCNLFFGFPEFRLGNILTTPFEEIWQHSALTFFRTFAGNRCPRRSCLLHTRCHGGCPAHSYAIYGKRSAPEPRCVRPE